MKRLVLIFISLLLLIIIPGCITAKAPVSEGKPSVIGAFSSNPTAINPGGTSTLSWIVTGANSVSIDQGIGQVDATGTKVVSPTTSTMYTITATNAAGIETKSTTTVNSASVATATTPFAVTSVLAKTAPSVISGACPKTFTFYATITANSPGTVTYIWESYDGNYGEFSDNQTVIFYEAGTKTETLQFEFRGTASGMHRVHVLTPNDIVSDPIYYELNCFSGSLVTGIVVGIDQYPFIDSSCPKTINFWGIITTNGPGSVTYRWERSDGNTDPETIIFAAAGSQTVTNKWTRGVGIGWQSLHVLTPDNGLSSRIDIELTCNN